MQCGDDARCDYDPRQDSTVCVCNQGFFGDGYRCVHGSELPGELKDLSVYSKMVTFAQSYIPILLYSTLLYSL